VSARRTLHELASERHVGNAYNNPRSPPARPVPTRPPTGCWTTPPTPSTCAHPQTSRPACARSSPRSSARSSPRRQYGQIDRARAARRPRRGAEHRASTGPRPARIERAPPRGYSSSPSFRTSPRSTRARARPRTRSSTTIEPSSSGPGGPVRRPWTTSRASPATKSCARFPRPRANTADARRPSRAPTARWLPPTRFGRAGRARCC